MITSTLIAAAGSGQNEKKAREAKKKNIESERIDGDVKPAKAGDGIPNVDIGLRKKPSGMVIHRTRTDEKGGFSFGVLPAGSYAIVIEEHPAGSLKRINLNSSKSNICVVTIEGTTSGQINREWAATGKASAAETARQSQASSFGEKALELPFESDGRKEIRGTLKTKHDTVKNSISNIR